MLLLFNERKIIMVVILLCKLDAWSFRTEACTMRCPVSHVDARPVHKRRKHTPCCQIRWVFRTMGSLLLLVLLLLRTGKIENSVFPLDVFSSTLWAANVPNRCAEPKGRVFSYPMNVDFLRYGGVVLRTVFRFLLQRLLFSGDAFVRAFSSSIFYTAYKRTSVWVCESMC